jgi:hypothetical protein
MKKIRRIRRWIRRRIAPFNGLSSDGLSFDRLNVDGLSVDGLSVDGLSVDGLPLNHIVDTQGLVPRDEVDPFG